MPAEERTPSELYLPGSQGEHPPSEAPEYVPGGQLFMQMHWFEYEHLDAESSLLLNHSELRL